jgi:serine/threonine-protein kinase
MERAADNYLRARLFADSSRCLDAVLRVDPEQHRARLLSGRLLLEQGLTEAAVRALQQIPPHAAEHGAALALLEPSLRRLGLAQAAALVAEERQRLGAAAVELSAVAQSRAPDVLFGRYEVARALRPTAHARVYEAIDRMTSARVAVKVMATSSAEDAGRDAIHRFEREVTALARLAHPAIVPLIEYVPHACAYVMKWMGGGSLAERLGAGSLAPAHAVEIVLSVLSALAEAHRRGILHRDVKPSNVLFDDAGAAYLSDFGSAHLSDRATTVTGGVIGTLAYMAPEQRRGLPATVRSDVYGAGAVLCHALTGAPPVSFAGAALRADCPTASFAGAALRADCPTEARPFLSTELGAVHLAVVEHLIAAESERATDAEDAIVLLKSVRWPDRRPPTPSPTSPPTPELASERLEPLADGIYRDRLLEREVIVVNANEENLARALAFARAGHPNLQTVLAFFPERAELWLENVIGDRVVPPLDAADRALLEQALEALHQAGGCHGAVGAEHLIRRAGEVVLCLPPRGIEESTAEDDLRALARLASG